MPQLPKLCPAPLPPRQVTSDQPAGGGIATDALVTVADPTGAVKAVLDTGVLGAWAERHGARLRLEPGTVLELQRLSVVSPAAGSHYLNIATPQNIAAVRFAGGQLRFITHTIRLDLSGSGPYTLTANPEWFKTVGAR